MIERFDTYVFRALNNAALVSPALDAVAVFFAVFLVLWMIACVCALGMSTFLPRYRLAGTKNGFLAVEACAAAIFARFGVTEIIRFFYSRPRPFEALVDVHQLLFRDGGGAFPSGHAAFSFALASVISREYPKFGILLYAAATILSLSRVFAGVHWPTDIIGGAAIGIAAGLSVHAVLKTYLRRVA